MTTTAFDWWMMIDMGRRFCWLVCRSIVCGVLYCINGCCDGCAMGCIIGIQRKYHLFAQLLDVVRCDLPFASATTIILTRRLHWSRNNWAFSRFNLQTIYSTFCSHACIYGSSIANIINLTWLPRSVLVKEPQTISCTTYALRWCNERPIFCWRFDISFKIRLHIKTPITISHLFLAII